MQFVLSAREFLYTRENISQPKDDPVITVSGSSQSKFIHSSVSLQPVFGTPDKPREPFYIPNQQGAVFGGSSVFTFGTPVQQGAVFGDSSIPTQPVAVFGCASAPTFGTPVQQGAGFGAVINPYLNHPIIKNQLQSIREQLETEEYEYSQKVVMLNLAHEISSSAYKEYILIDPSNLYCRIQSRTDKLKGYTEKMIHQVAIEKGYKVEYDGNFIKLIPQ